MSEEPTPTAKQTAVDRPTRGAERNQSLVDRADPATDDLLLPALESGVTLLEVDGDRGAPVLQSLVLDHLLLHDGPAFWIDADGHATTSVFARIAPSRALLDRVHVARGFTAYQHYGAVCDLPTAVNRSIDRAGERSPHTPSLLVAPAVDALYRGEDRLGPAHAETLQARTLARLASYAEAYDAPVLLTRSESDEFTEPVATVADQRLVCERTRLGPRFVGEDFETLLYPIEGGTGVDGGAGVDGDTYYQTTFAYWRQVLGARANQLGLDRTRDPDSVREPASGPGPAGRVGNTGVGTGVTTDGETATLNADPLLDAWAGDGGR